MTDNDTPVPDPLAALVADDSVAPGPSAEVKAIVEALIFASPEPITPKRLCRLLSEEPKEDVLAAVESLKADYENRPGLQLVEVAGGYQIVTRSELNDWVRRLFHEVSTSKLTVAGLETLAVIAYKQPITALEIGEIRGVNTSGVLSTLLERHLIKIAGRKNVVGSPFLYRTTKDFLVHFGLNDVRDMPRLEEFGDLIGEAINEDLVAAIETAPQTSESEVTEPATTEEAAAHEAAALDELVRQEVQSSVVDERQE